MLSIIKERKIEKELKTIQEARVFDYEKGESFLLPKESSELDRNIYFFTASSYEKRQTIVFRLEVTTTQTNAWIYFVDGFNRYYLEQTDYTTNCPLKIFKEEGIWNIVFAGYLKKNNNKDLSRLTFAAKFLSNEDAIDSSLYLNEKQVSKILLKEKKTEEFYNDLKNKQYTEYHQFGKLKGKIILEGQNSPLDMPCFRKHTYGKIDWSTINNNFSIAICNKKNSYLYEMMSLPSISILETGLIKQESKELKKSNLNKYERQLLLKGSAPENLNILMKLEEDEDSIGIHAKKIDTIKYILQEGEYSLTIGVAEFLINGINYRGVFELGYNKDRSRWFNGKDISKLLK